VSEQPRGHILGCFGLSVDRVLVHCGRELVGLVHAHILQPLAAHQHYFELLVFPAHFELPDYCYHILLAPLDKLNKAAWLKLTGRNICSSRIVDHC